MHLVHRKVGLDEIHAFQEDMAALRAPVVIAEQRTLVMCDQLATVDLTRLTEPVGSSVSRRCPVTVGRVRSG